MDIWQPDDPEAHHRPLFDPDRPTSVWRVAIGVGMAGLFMAAMLLAAFPAWSSDTRSWSDRYELHEIDAVTYQLCFYNSEKATSSEGQKTHRANDLFVRTDTEVISGGPETVTVKPEGGWVARPSEVTARDGEEVCVKIERPIG